MNTNRAICPPAPVIEPVVRLLGHLSIILLLAMMVVPGMADSNDYDKNDGDEKHEMVLWGQKIDKDTDAEESLSFYEAAEIIKKKGIDPFSREARSYYCELGFTGLDTMGVYYVSFCPDITQLKLVNR